MLQEAAPLRPVHALTMGEVGGRRRSWRRRRREEVKITLEKPGWIPFTGALLPPQPRLSLTAECIALIADGRVHRRDIPGVSSKINADIRMRMHQVTCDV
jgi:hypothetical protein